ncbi:hypothetical protein KFL_004920060 [Klebsormidium nitens]|uniref:RRM domain-containing protein n=1 Tax=Klebsormidium nitens TaxID=105231 RepID=A0A1Y1IKF2_KLENI|nr:hypothetical protein KFL_004920060 [Klebsormidium nitens]|eukprot:GAQ89157.1 hypothetical protein KFL_004920060 [Klebsormidium nitens]
MATLYVGNFVFAGVSEIHLRRAFQTFGPLRCVQMKRNYAFVTFADVRAAQEAVHAYRAGLVLHGEQILVRWVRMHNAPGGGLRELPTSFQTVAYNDRARPHGCKRFTGCRDSLRQGAPAGSFCTIYGRAGHSTAACRYNVRTIRAGGVDMARAKCAWDSEVAKRGDGNLASGSGARLEGGVEPRPNLRGRGCSAGNAGLGSRQTSPKKIFDLDEPDARMKPPSGGDRRSDFVVNGELMQRASDWFRGYQRREPSMSRAIPRSGQSSAGLSLTRCSDSRCSCQSDTSLSSPSSSDTFSSCNATFLTPKDGVKGTNRRSPFKM